MAEGGERSGEETINPAQIAFEQRSRENFAVAMEGWEKEIATRREQNESKRMKIRLDGPNYLSGAAAKARYGSEFPILCEFSVGDDQETWVVLRKKTTDGKHALNSSAVDTLSVAKLDHVNEKAQTYRGKRHRRPTSSPITTSGEGNEFEEAPLRINRFTEQEFSKGQSMLDIIYKSDDSNSCLVTLTIASDMLQLSTNGSENVRIKASPFAHVTEEELLQETNADEIVGDTETPQEIAAQLLGVSLNRTSYVNQSESDVLDPELSMQIADETIPVPHGVLVLDDTSGAVIGFVDEIGHFRTFTTDQEGTIQLPAVVEKRLTEVKSIAPTDLATEPPDGDLPDPTYRTVMTKFYYENVLARQDDAARAFLNNALKSRYSYVGRHGERAKKLPSIDSAILKKRLTARRAATDLRRTHR